MSTFLANHYHTVWVPEFAREYCEKLTEPPTWQDEVNMFHGQLALEAELLPQADIVVVITPLTAETRHLMNVDRIARMKRGALLVNPARGPASASSGSRP